MDERTIAGEWHGRYVYGKYPQAGGDFAAFFSEDSGNLHGTIVDDGSSGKASVNGTFSFPSVQFTKIYLKASESKKVETEIAPPKFTIFGIGITHKITKTRTENFGDPVKYNGTMSEDGRSMSGRWDVTSEDGSRSDSGTWTMNKLTEDQEQEEIQTTVKKVKAKETEDVF